MRRSGLLIAAPLLAIALGVTACGSSSSGGSTPNGGSGPGGTSTPKVPTEDINPQPVSALQQGGTLTWSGDEYPTNWNVYTPDGNETTVTNAMYALMPLGQTSDAAANVGFDPNFWLSAKQTATSPEQTIEYKLNPKGVWSDGVPITEADFAAQAQALSGKSKAYQAVSTVGYDQIDSVSQGPGGKYDVIVKFKKPFSEWQTLFSPLYPAKYMSTPAGFNSGYINKIPVTANAFKFGAFNKSAQTITIVPDPKWWGSNKPLLNKIVFVAEASDAANQAFANGELDYDYDIAVDPSDYKAVKGAKGGHTTLAAGPDLRQFTFNATHAPMTDLKVRQAIVMGINRDAIIKADLKGIPWPAIPLNNHFFVNTQAGYVDNSDPYAKYNPTAAKSLLETDGYTMSGGYYTKGGKTLEIGFTIPAGIQSSKNEGEIFQALMQQIGIKVDIKTVPLNAFFDKDIIPGNFNVTPFSYIGTPFPISSSAGNYLSPKNGGGGNYTGEANPAIDKLINEAQSAPTVSASRADLNQADKLLFQEVHTLTIFQRPSINGVNNKLANIGSFGFASVDYTKIGFMK